MAEERFRRAFSSRISQAARTVSQYAKEPFISKENGEIMAIRSDDVKNAARAVAQIWETWTMSLNPMLDFWTARCTKVKPQEVVEQYPESEKRI